MEIITWNPSTNKIIAQSALFWGSSAKNCSKMPFFGQNKGVFGQKRVFLTLKEDGANHFKTSMHVFYQDMCCWWVKNSILHIKL